jgi:hypothetical protein
MMEGVLLGLLLGCIIFVAIWALSWVMFPRRVVTSRICDDCSRLCLHEEDRG